MTRKTKSAKVSGPATPPEDFSNAGDDMHEEDRAAHRDGYAYAAHHAGEFVEMFADEMRNLIADYPDSVAEAKFWELRERFWARLWTPADKKASGA